MAVANESLNVGKVCTDPRLLSGCLLSWQTGRCPLILHCFKNDDLQERPVVGLACNEDSRVFLGGDGEGVLFCGFTVSGLWGAVSVLRTRTVVQPVPLLRVLLPLSVTLDASADAIFSAEETPAQREIAASRHLVKRRSVRTRAARTTVPSENAPATSPSPPCTTDESVPRTVRVLTLMPKEKEGPQKPNTKGLKPTKGNGKSSSLLPSCHIKTAADVLRMFFERNESPTTLVENIHRATYEDVEPFVALLGDSNSAFHIEYNPAHQTPCGCGTPLSASDSVPDGPHCCVLSPGTTVCLSGEGKLKAASLPEKVGECSSALDAAELCLDICPHHGFHGVCIALSNRAACEIAAVERFGQPVGESFVQSCYVSKLIKNEVPPEQRAARPSKKMNTFASRTKARR